ncbi:Bud site selection protein RAX2 [Apiospora arundinis]|uniref:Cortical protein marker for cell polarity-domain-containing protein n=1 Tax=Apiospora arundinis TaxID=335852 RepID=A0ABR2J9P8_9PEZI
MRITYRRRPASRKPANSLTSYLFGLTTIATLSQALTVTPVPSPDLDLSNLGRVAVAGDFAGISLYEFEGQTEQPFNTNGSESLMTRLPNGVFSNILTTDASIQTICSFRGALILGGNFTSLDGKSSTGIAQFNLTDSTLSPIAGLLGQVNSLLCDDAAGKVYVGGSFKAADSTNAITWVAGNNWASLPFAGFNGPVTSITKASNGHIVFGGRFTGLGNTSTPSQPDEQVINLSTAQISANQGTTAAGFSDPKNIICKTDGVDGAGNTWLLADNTPGSWSAKFRHGFEPTKIRLWNTHQDGRGVRTWRYTALPINGIMNFTYLDPKTNQNMSCTSECPLSDDPSVQFQDFHFVNNVGMNEFRIDISAWYGKGGGLNGIELLQDDIFAYAINEFNEPACANTSFASSATTTGDWKVTPSGQSNADYLSVNIPSPVSSAAASITFFPDIRETGNYTLSLYTPGCLQDNTCGSRGQVNVTWNVSPNTPANSKVLFQTNNFDKYDVLDMAILDASSSSFKPSVTITALNNQDLSSMTMVAQKVNFVLMNSTGGLNGLFDYDPSKAKIDTADFSTSAFDKLGSTFSKGSAVSALATTGDVTYIGGNFTTDKVRNIVAVNSKDKSTVQLDDGTNGQIMAMALVKNQLFVGGSFNNTSSGSNAALNNVAVYDTASNKWTALGAGVNGPAMNIVSMTLNLTSGKTEDVIAVTGTFSRLLAFGSNPERSVNGFAVWVKSQSNWLQNVNGPVPFLDGILATAHIDGDKNSVFAGTLSSQVLRTEGAAILGGSLGAFPLNIQPPTPTANTTTNVVGVRKRISSANSTDVSGVVTGAFHKDNGSNMTILAGHFSATASDGKRINNLAFIDGGANNKVTGLPDGVSDDSSFRAVAIQGSTLFAGGRVNGTVGGSAVNGLVSFDMANRKFNQQPPALSGADGIVTSITVRPDSGDVFVGGSFEDAGSLDCPGLCVFSTSAFQWSRPGFGLQGEVKAMIWASKTKVVVGGNMTLNDTSAFLASYDASSSSWSGFPELPGPVNAITAGNKEGTQFWVSGNAKDGSVYLMKYDGSSMVPAGINFGPETVIKSLQVFTVTESHNSKSDLVDSNQVLMITGSLAIPTFGKASSALFDGEKIRPYALTSNTGNSAGSIAKIFVENPDNFFKPSSSGLAVGFIVLIGLAISLALMLLIVVAGLALDRYRKKRDGYVPAPTSMYDRGSGMRRIPPHELLDSLSKGRPGAPHV